ncbi:MAG TPA: MMPL family transporter [Planosporangium sp.]|nr:MMPL family transporter [Planosporangium sp.]
MMRPLSQFTYEKRRLLIYLSAALFVLAGAVGGSVIPKLSTGGFVDVGTESSRAKEILARDFHTGPPNLILLVTDLRGVDDPAVARAGQAVTERLAGEPDVVEVISYWSSHSPALRGEAGDRALVLARITGSEDETNKRMVALDGKYSGTVEGLRVEIGGAAQANHEVIKTTESDLIKIEAVTLPIVFLILILVFRGLIAALLPLTVSLLTIVSVLLLLRVLTLFTDVSVLATNVTTGLGLGLAIDYSLFIITRYREELRHGRAPEEAIARTLRTAGRTVLFSAVTVALSLSALLVFPFYFLRSFAYAGIPTALVAALIAVTTLPAMLAVLGRRLEKFPVFPRRRTQPEPEQGFWHRLAVTVMRFPIPVATAVIMLLLFLGSPFLNLRMSLTDDRVLPEQATARQVGTVLREKFSAMESQPLDVVLTGAGQGADRQSPVSAYAADISRLSGVARVDTFTGSYVHGAQAAGATAQSARFAAPDSVYLSVTPKVESLSEQGKQLVGDIRALQPPGSTRAWVAGPAAELVDSLDSMYSRLPLALLVVGVASLVVLFLFTGSVVLPIKALVLNCLSLSATFGVLVWGFQDGHLKGVVGNFEATGTITWTVPILLFCIAFGLSMDYEVFLLSRIKEEYGRSGDNTLAVARGLERIGRLVSAAAILMAVVFLGFILSGIVYLKAIGVGLALAVLMDAFLVRGALVPAFMRLAGRFNWWAPAPLRALHRRVGLRESDDEPPQPPTTAAAATSAGQHTG